MGVSAGLTCDFNVCVKCRPTPIYLSDITEELPAPANREPHIGARVVQFSISAKKKKKIKIRKKCHFFLFIFIFLTW